MSTPTSKSHTSTWVGILLGVVILGLISAFAIGLQKAHGDESGSADSQAPLALPDTLPGGYIASDDPKAFEGGQLAEQADQIVEQEQANADYGNEVLPEVLGVEAATRTYVADGSQAVFVQAFRAAGHAFSPNNIPDPEASGGQAPTELVAVGDGACILTYGQAAAGQPAAVAFSQCQVSRGDLTVQIASAAIEAKDMVKIADDLITELDEG